MVVSLEPIFCNSFETFKALRRFAFKHGEDKTLNNPDNILDFPNILLDDTSLHITIGFVEVATIISTAGIFIEAILDINVLIVWIVWEKLNLFKHENDESITIET